MRKWHTAAIYIFLLMEGVSTVCFYGFSDMSVGRKGSVKGIVNYLKKEQIKYVYTADCMVPFELMFYSGNSIFARMPYQPARDQAASDSVDNALKRGDRVAVVKYNDGSDTAWDNTQKFSDFYVVENMPAEIVVKEFDVK